jgi:hypothetical protein
LPRNPNAAKAGTVIKHTGTPVGEVIKHTGTPATSSAGITTTTNKVTGITTKTDNAGVTTITDRAGDTVTTNKNTGINVETNTRGGGTTAIENTKTGITTIMNKDASITTIQNNKTDTTTTTNKNTGVTTTENNNGVTTTSNKNTGVTTTTNPDGVTTTTNNNTGITTTTNKNTGVTTTTKGGGGGTTIAGSGDTATAGGGTTPAGGGGKTGQGGIGPVAGVMGGVSGNFTPINNQSVTIFRGPRPVWIGGVERTFVAASVLPGLYLGSDYYAPQGYIAVAQPACYGRTAEGCLLRWQQVPLESGGADVQCVQLCRSGGVAQGPGAQPTAAVAQAFASEPMAPAPAEAQTAGGCEVAIYADANFAGQATATVENQPRLGDVGWKGEIASVRVKGGTWDFFSDDDYGGQTMRLPPGEYAQFGSPWTKQISSFMCLGQQ